MMTPKLLAGAVIAFAVALGIARSLLSQWRRSDPAWTRGLVLAAGSIAAGVLLFLSLFPPATPFARGTLVVATAGAPHTLKPASGERLIALPEAPALATAERVPDLATALRRDGQPARLRVVGVGLTARDRSAAAGIAIDFRPSPSPRGVIALASPTATSAGSAFAIGGRTSRLGGGMAELLDPAGRRVDARALGRDGSFTLIGTARAPGMVMFTLRVRDAKRAVAAELAVPLWTVPDPTPRVLMIGAPGPDTKYLRRWAADAGIDVTSRLEAGGGIQLGDAPMALTAATLARYDALILDDRSWSGLGPGLRSIVSDAVARGLGVVIRMTGPTTASMRREWTALGLSIAGGEARAPVALSPQAVDADALAAQRSPAGPDDATAGIDDPTPDIGRWDIRTGSDVVPLIRDDDGAILAGWRQRGLGRVAIWALADSYALVLTGQADRYFGWWSRILTAVARAEPQFAPDFAPGLARVGQRSTICGVGGEPRVTGPNGRETRLVVVQGCAAYWPTAAGLHTLIQPVRGAAVSRPFYVYAPDQLSGITATELAEATTALVNGSQGIAASRAIGERPGPASPWFLGWLAVSASLWWLERRRPG